MNRAKNTTNINIIKIYSRSRNKPYGPKTIFADIHNLIAIKEKNPLIQG